MKRKKKNNPNGIIMTAEKVEKGKTMVSCRKTMPRPQCTINPF
jgi:hypothetical protein